jgi:hypothetical protein
MSECFKPIAGVACSPVAQQQHFLCVLLLLVLLLLLLLLFSNLASHLEGVDVHAVSMSVRAAVAVRTLRMCFNCTAGAVTVFRI